MDQVAGKTNKLVEMGSDLAATYGGTTKEAVEALGSALRGETDPIEKYGVSIKQADINAQMAKDGTDKLTGAAAKQARTMTLLSMITKQTADAHGQFAEESGSASGSAQIAAAQFENMKSALGTALLPVVSKVAAALGKLAVFMGKHKTATTIAIVAILALSVAIIALTVAVNLYVWATTAAAAATMAAWIAAIWPILLIVAAVAAVIAIVVVLWKKFPPFRNAVIAVWTAIRTAAVATARAIASAWNATLNALKSAWNAVRSVAVAASRAVSAAWRSVLRGISAAGRATSSALKSAWNAVKSATQSVISVVQKLIARIRSIKVPGAIRSAFHAIAGVISGVISKVSSLISKLRGIKVPAGIAGALNAIRSAADQLANAIGRIVSKISSIRAPHIDWPSPPSWFGKLKPKGLAFTPPGVATPQTSAYVAPTGRSGRMAGRAVAPAAPGPTIVVNGALDPEAVARQIQRILGGHSRRMGHAAA